MRSKNLLPLILIMLLCNTAKGKAQAVNSKDSLILVNLYDSTGGPHWINHSGWLTSAPLATWYGITINDFGDVSTVNLPGNNLTGNIPLSLGNFTLLDNLQLNHNNLAGNIPAQLGNLSWLSVLNLDSNKLTGAIPANLGSGRLVAVILSNNQLSGNIPGSLVGSRLNILALNNNHLDGVVPQEILSDFNIGSLGFLYLQHNYFTFTGAEPVAAKTIGTRVYAPQDTVLPLQYSNYTLSVSAGGTLGNNTYRWYKNGLPVKTITGDSTYAFIDSGRYSVAVTNSLATSLTLYSDTITVSVAPAVQDSLILVNLYNTTNGPGWTARNNWLTSEPLDTWDGISLTTDRRVSRLKMEYNNVSGPIPPSLGELSELLYMTFYGNHLTGTIPPELGKLTNITFLNLSYNYELTGSIPVQLGNLTNLEYLSVEENKLTGSIPPVLGNLTKLTALDLGDNKLTGSIPPELGNLTYLTDILIGPNQLTGSIPAQLGNLINVTQLSLSQCQLTGNIPPEFGKLVNLKRLLISDNQLSGSIPAQLGKMVKLEDLQIHHNQLTGSIPAELSNCKSLIYAFFNDNHLSGSIPAGLAYLPYLQFYYAFQNNNFTFDGLEAIARNFNFATYSPQYSIPLKLTGRTLSVYAGGTLSNNTYTWYKNNVLIKTKIGNSTLVINRPGNYSVAVTNSIATNLTLYSDTLNVTLLPVTLTAFTGILEKNDVQLHWQTATEINAGYYAVERSIDGSAFTGLGNVVAAGNSTVTQRYRYTDYNAARLNEGALYYRLKMVDNDGQLAYSNTVKIKFDDAGVSLSAYPNPARSKATVRFTAASAGRYTIDITDLSGKVIKRMAGVSVIGANNITLDASGLAGGTYVITLTGDGTKESLKMVKQ